LRGQRGWPWRWPLSPCWLPRSIFYPELAQSVLPATHMALLLTLEPVFAWITSFLVMGERLGFARERRTDDSSGHRSDGINAAAACAYRA